MSKLKILIDTNVLLDYLAIREPFSDLASKVFNYCSQEKIEGYAAVHSFLNMFFILRKHIPDSNERREKLLDLAEIISIVEVDSGMIMSSLKNKGFKDFEDCVQAECAFRVGADYIVTRNIKDFEQSRIKAVTPEVLIEILDKE